MVTLSLLKKNTGDSYKSLRCRPESGFGEKIKTDSSPARGHLVRPLCWETTGTALRQMCEKRLKKSGYMVNGV